MISKIEIWMHNQHVGSMGMTTDGLCAFEYTNSWMGAYDIGDGVAYTSQAELATHRRQSRLHIVPVGLLIASEACYT